MNDEIVYLKNKINELESVISSLERDLIHDSLTNLKTRAFFEEESETYLSAISNLEKEKRKTSSGFKNICILFFDIDHFKKINDTYGHDIGDMVLKKVAEIVKKSVRDGDTVARWGGEEIVASLLGASEEAALKKAEQICKEIREINFEHDPDFRVTVSVGVASNKDATRLSEIVKNADKALYKAKQNGRNGFVLYSDTL